MHVVGATLLHQEADPIPIFTIIAKRAFLLNRLTCCNQSMLDFVAHHQTMHRKKITLSLDMKRVGFACEMYLVVV